MTEAKKTESTKGFHIQGIWAVVVAVITLVVGFLLRPAVDNIGYPKYADIGGVWKPHGDLSIHCEIATVKDTFYISVYGTYEGGIKFRIQGKGKLEKQSGSFTGEMQGNSPFEVWGHAETAGSDQLGITLFLDKERTQHLRSYAFIREISSSVDLPKNEASQ